MIQFSILCFNDLCVTDGTTCVVVSLSPHYYCLAITVQCHHSCIGKCITHVTNQIPPEYVIYKQIRQKLSIITIINHSSHSGTSDKRPSEKRTNFLRQLIGPPRRARTALHQTKWLPAWPQCPLFGGS